MNMNNKIISEDVLENVAGGVPYVNDPNKPKSGGIHMGGGYQ